MIISGVVPPLLLAVCFTVNSDSKDRVERVRPVGATTRHALQVGGERSKLFRTLLERLQQSDVIVHVQSAINMPCGVDERLQFAAAPACARYLRITLRGTLSPNRTISILGHELMHVVEVATHEEVRDVLSFRGLYSRIGHSANGRRFDTRAAVDAGDQVFLDVVGRK